MLLGDVTKDQLEHYFFVEALRVKQVARLCSCNVRIIRQYMKQYSIKLDPSIWYNQPSHYLRKLLVQGVKFTPRQESIVVGCILGDGSLYKSDGSINANLMFSQKISRKRYVEWLRDELQPFVPHPVSESSTTANGIKHFNANIHTVYHSEFTRFRNLFYPSCYENART